MADDPNDDHVEVGGSVLGMLVWWYFDVDPSPLFGGCPIDGGMPFGVSVCI